MAPRSEGTTTHVQVWNFCYFSCVQVHLGDTPHNLTESDFEVLARRTDGFSGSDISVCVKDVVFDTKWCGCHVVLSNQVLCRQPCRSLLQRGFCLGV
ncbi:UNVERIFIED_CONTAM: protein SUPPRESSOR OF K(+) TRANSPORT GROWTH DEFECT 1 [Sesamum radiatum]|uniref:Protein SUPPRESSOR OF K(+) TRANSPORT GROWTH DEFECT 1 n=1 Tax=Sesamum radiatum TaxID=300843 RepID=A0AAW2URV1_SESRA